MKQIAKDIVTDCTLDKASSLFVVISNFKKSFEMICEFCTVGEQLRISLEKHVWTFFGGKRQKECLWRKPL